MTIFRADLSSGEKAVSETKIKKSEFEDDPQREIEAVPKLMMSKIFEEFENPASVDTKYKK